MDLLPHDVTVVSWSAVAGKHYNLNASEDGLAFLPIRDNITAAGAVQSVVLNIARPKSWFFRFFRVRAFGP